MLGAASSAAAVGVGARKSATKSAIVKSVSWPTAEIIGISLLKIALATISSLKAHNSSIEPPPRQRLVHLSLPFHSLYESLVQSREPLTPLVQVPEIQ